MFGKLLSGIFNNIKPISTNLTRQYWDVTPGPYSKIPVKKKTRYNWPRPRETKKIATYGIEKKLSTEHGRKVLMKRILAGRYSISH